ncbi:hypothetical protein GCM10022247_29840 [Allokutzneria multivorans]|uniref:Amphi-Trp domain-containing protein n=1 Tax=Allokutzneria multivorans TaxID=1142134 RepID=A0ABP7S3M6_9PSEU
MTEVYEEPTRIVTHYFDNLADAVEALEATERLSLGVRLHNRTTPETEPDGTEVLAEEWVVEVYDAPPIESEDDSEEEDEESSDDE